MSAPSLPKRLAPRIPELPARLSVPRHAATPTAGGGALSASQSVPQTRRCSRRVSALSLCGGGDAASAVSGSVAVLGPELGPPPGGVPAAAAPPPPLQATDTPLSSADGGEAPPLLTRGGAGAPAPAPPPPQQQRPALDLSIGGDRERAGRKAGGWGGRFAALLACMRPPANSGE